MEKWKEIIDGRYEVSNKGRVRNAKTKYIISTKFPSLPYPRLGYKEDGEMRFKQVHRLVAEAFIPNPNNKSFVNHKNGVKSDNRVENLEWVTRQENEDHAFATGLKDSTGSANVQAKLDEDTVRYIKNSFNGDPKDVYRLVEETDVHRATIQRILRGKIWNHVLPNKNVNKIEREYKKGSKNPTAKLTEKEAREIKYSKKTYKELAEEYNVSGGLIGHIKNGRAWKHI